MRYGHIAGIVVLLLLTACGHGKSSPGRTAVDSTPSDRTPHMARMELKAMPMLPVVRAHLDSLDRNPTTMHAVMAQHQTEVKHLVDAMHSDMMALGMHSDAAYEALADSVVRGSARLGTAGGAEFKRLVAEHIGQMRRLAAMYESKTASM
jgi:hypothetical protein